MLAVRLVAVIVLFTAAALLPFLPGRHDPVAVPLSAMVLLAGKAGLLLVPIGATWLQARSPTAGRRLARASLVWFASHDMDYLRPDGRGRPRGWFTSVDTGHPHWKAFLFD